MSNRHNHHLATREAQEATQTKADSRRRHSERTKRRQTNPTQALGATPPHTHAGTRCNATPHTTQSLGACKFTIFLLRPSQDVVAPSRRHFGPKLLRPRICFENVSKFSVGKSAQSHTPRHHDGRQTHCGPVCLADRLGVVGPRRNRRDHTRFRTEHFAAAKLFRNFRSESRRKIRAISHAAAS